MKKIVFAGLVMIFFQQVPLMAQNNRSNDYNNIGWYMYFGDHKVTKKMSIHTEYQWRRNHFVTIWQQSLLRVGLNYQLLDRLMVTGGYGFILTYPYGKSPIAKTGYPFPEHRIYEQVVMKDKFGRVDLSHRFRLEQRWVADLKVGEGHKIDHYNYRNRARYQLRIAMPFKGKTIDPGKLYLAMYDEIFVGFGKNVKANIFDQNRLYAALGYKANPKMSIELGYLNQILAHGDGKVFEYNNGLQASLTYNLDFTQKETAPAQ